MAVYKVIQDIEAEDKLFGPLTLKGFVYLAIAGILVFIDIRLAVSGIPGWVKILLTLIFALPTLLFATLASPLGREQPTEAWLLSHIRYLFKARKRKWDQSGIKQLVVITAPKKVKRVLTKSFSPEDVSSRLQALANTLDSRGWAIKNVGINETPGRGMAAVDENDDRIASATTLTEAEPVLDIRPGDDMLDVQNNPTAQKMDSLIAFETEMRNRELKYQMVPNADEVVRSTPAEEESFLDSVHKREAMLRSAHIDLGPPVDAKTQAVKKELAKGNDLSVAAIASLAKRNAQGGEVNVPLS